MLKKILIILGILLISSASYAADLKNIGYRDLSNGSKVKIIFDTGWTDKIKNKDMEHYVVKGSELYSYGGEFFYDTECSFIFIRKGCLIGYSDKTFQFWEFTPFEGKILKRELVTDEISEMFPSFRMIKLSEFSPKTNSYKFRKKKSHENIMILNDKGLDMSGYSFSTNNAKFENYAVNNAIEITKSGMIQLSRNGENTKQTPWFVLLAR